MVRIFEHADQIGIDFTEHRVEAARVGKTAHREHAPPGHRNRHLAPVTLLIAHQAPSVASVACSAVICAMVSHLARGDRAGRSGIPLDTMMAACARRMARSGSRIGPAGSTMAIAEAALAVDQHQVDVASNRSMLKRVVENDHIGRRDFADAYEFHRFAARATAIGPRNDFAIITGSSPACSGESLRRCHRKPAPRARHASCCVQSRGSRSD